ncbi:hypothetical protein [Amycolatopsis nigrescens]|uniref:hypothetical protein n=1 Tax=Amycolatopsis nigrescens TaxID=381445 RepID=UPI00035E2759|nr:hypothetical protein [Amycolatopsis nigrescens]
MSDAELLQEVWLTKVRLAHLETDFLYPHEQQATRLRSLGEQLQELGQRLIERAGEMERDT